MISFSESTTIRYEFYVEQNLAKPKQAAALRSLVTFKFDSAFICDVSARASYHLAVIVTHQEAHLKTVSSFRICL